MKGFTFAIAVAVHAAAATALAQGYAVRGEVRAANGDPIEGAVVELRTADGAPSERTVTRRDGGFEFRHLEPAEYRVAVRAEGFAPGEERVARAEMAEWLHVVLTPAGRPARGGKPDGSPFGQPFGGPVVFAQSVPDGARAAYLKGVAEIRAGKRDDGVRLLREAVRRFDEYYDAHVALGVQLSQIGRFGEAVEAFDRARRINDRDAAVQHALGLALMQQRRFDEAAEAFRAAASLPRPRATSHYHLARAIIELSGQVGDPSARAARLAEAEVALARAWELSGGSLAAVHIERARIHERRGDREAAAREVEAYLAAEPRAANAAALRAAVVKLRKVGKE